MNGPGGRAVGRGLGRGGVVGGECFSPDTSGFFLGGGDVNNDH